MIVRIEALTQLTIRIVELLPFFGERFLAAVAAIILTATDVIAVVADTITLVLLVSACAGADYGVRVEVRIFAFTLQWCWLMRRGHTHNIFALPLKQPK